MYDFPTSPTTGDTSNGYTFNGIGWVLASGGGGGGGGIPEAPNDTRPYARKSLAWDDLTDDFAMKEPTITPGTTSQFWRGDKAWVALPPSGVPEAPDDAHPYVRKSLSWSDFSDDMALKANVTEMTDADNLRVLKAGDTMTGLLSIQAGGYPTLVVQAVGSPGHAAILLDKNSTPNTLSSIGGYRGGSQRWGLVLGDNALETGGNTGSDFVLRSYTDTGGTIADVLKSVRASGLLTVNGNPTANLGIATKQYVDAFNTSITSTIAPDLLVQPYTYAEGASGLTGPISGGIGTDNTNWASVTAVYVSNINKNGVNIGDVNFLTAKVGSKLIVFKDFLNYAHYTVTNGPTNKGAWVLFAVTLNTYYGSIPNGASVWLEFDAGIADAPNDGQPYVRKSQAWAVSTGGAVAEAPNDGKLYARKSLGWDDLTDDFAAKEPTITAGTTSQYRRGDKTWQTLDKSAVGLINVDNTSDAAKPVSTAQAAAIGTKEPTIIPGTTADYWRGDKTWQPLPSGGGGGIPEAPTDGDLYSRRGSDSSWQVSPSGGGGIPEAPTDGDLYSRRGSDGTWQVSPGVGSGITDAANDGTSYIRNSLGWKAAPQTGVFEYVYGGVYDGLTPPASTYFLVDNADWNSVTTIYISTHSLDGPQNLGIYLATIQGGTLCIIEDTATGDQSFFDTNGLLVVDSANMGVQVVPDGTAAASIGGVCRIGFTGPWPVMEASPADGVTYVRRDTNWLKLGSAGITYNFGDGGPSTPSSDYQMCFDAYPISDATQIFFVKIDFKGNQEYSLGLHLRKGATIILETEDDSTQGYIFKITSDADDGGTFYYTTPVEFQGYLPGGAPGFFGGRYWVHVGPPEPVSGGTITIGDTAPSSPFVNDVWIDTT